MYGCSLALERRNLFFSLKPLRLAVTSPDFPAYKQHICQPQALVLVAWSELHVNISCRHVDVYHMSTHVCTHFGSSL